MAPETSKISGSRKLPPISTSCPRETITSRPAARAFKARTVAAGVVVDGRRGLGAGQLAEQPRDPRGAPAARSVVEIELQVAIAASHLGHGRDGFVRERGPAQPGMQQDPGRVDHRPQ